ncbi:hypothetical protein [Picrophilus oshimae]|uniref:hypothetical protein n=1 Tax=Picrophilus oshimae TaxID=46632 RepID=UPI00064F2B4B|nr:hypothetical protein [Picrophilus oshimae]
MLSIKLFKGLIIITILISFIATYLNLQGILSYRANAYITYNIGAMVGLVFTIISVLLVLMLPEKKITK